MSLMRNADGEEGCGVGVVAWLRRRCDDEVRRSRKGLAERLLTSWLLPLLMKTDNAKAAGALGQPWRVHGVDDR
jgi:hypothetical protein